MELAEELTAKRCELKLHWLKRDDNQLADDLTNVNFDSFDRKFRVPLKGEDMQWRILNKLTKSADSFYHELKARKEEGRAKPNRFKTLASSKDGSWHLGSPVGFAREIAIRTDRVVSRTVISPLIKKGVRARCK